MEFFGSIKMNSLVVIKPRQEFLGISNADESYMIIKSIPFNGRYLCSEKDQYLIDTIITFVRHGSPRIMINESLLLSGTQCPLIVECNMVAYNPKCYFCNTELESMYFVKQYGNSIEYSDVGKECVFKIINFSEQVLYKIILKEVTRKFYSFFLFNISNNILMSDVIIIIMDFFIQEYSPSNVKLINKYL
jgi:hypothetical protein